MKPNFEPTDPNQYNIGFTRGGHHPFEPSTESVTEDLLPRLQPPHNVMEHMQQLFQLMNTANPVTYTWTFNLEGCQVNITISNHGLNKYKFSINNITNGNNFVVNSESGRFEVEGQGPYNRGFDFRNEIYLYHCTACPTISSVLPHIYICPVKSCKLGGGVNCYDPKQGHQGHRGYCTHGGNHYPQQGQLIYRFDCELARNICKDYENRALRQDTLPKCPLTLFQHPLTLSSHQ